LESTVASTVYFDKSLGHEACSLVLVEGTRGSPAFSMQEQSKNLPDKRED